MQALSTGIRYCFESLDRARRQHGTVMDHIGYSAIESPFRTILTLPGMRLRHYGGDESSDGTALIVPAPIKRHYIWDLSPERSVVQHALRRGMRVYLIEWTEAQARFGLEEYAHALIDHCVDAIFDAAGTRKVFLLSHSLGGTLTAIYAALQPQRVAGLVLLESPLHFGDATGSFAPLLALAPPAGALTQIFDTVPGSVLNLASGMASPATFNAERWADFVASLESDELLRSHLLVERWTLDESPMAGRLFEQLVEQLYREDRFMQGRLVLDGQTPSPANVRCPLFSVYDPRSLIIPPASIVAFHEAAGSAIKRLRPYHGDKGVALSHVGVLVGNNAHRRLWPEIFAWIGKRSARHS